MKRSIPVFVISSIISIAAVAAPVGDESADGKVQPEIVPVADDAAGPVSVLVLNPDSLRFERLVNNLCSTLVSGREIGSPTIAGDLENLILEYNGWTRDMPNYRAKLAVFWNANNNRIICDAVDVYPRSHFFKRVINIKYYTPVLVDFLLDDNDETGENLYPIDVNAFEIKDGKKETLLDYIDLILDDSKKREREGVGPRYNPDEIDRLRELIVTYYNGKHGSELG